MAPLTQINTPLFPPIPRCKLTITPHFCFVTSGYASFVELELQLFPPPLPPDTTGELNVLRHDSDTLGMNGAQVGVLK